MRHPAGSFHGLKKAIDLWKENHPNTDATGEKAAVYLHGQTRSFIYDPQKNELRITPQGLCAMEKPFQATT